MGLKHPNIIMDESHYRQFCNEYYPGQSIVGVYIYKDSKTGKFPDPYIFKHKESNTCYIYPKVLSESLDYCIWSMPESCIKFTKTVLRV